LLYYVDRLREGRSYSTRSVRAVQNGQTIFVMLCSFQIPEIWQPSRHWPMPKAPPPEDCEDEHTYYKRIANQSNVTEEFRARILGYVKVRLEHLFLEPGSLSGRCLSHERRAQSLSDLQASSQTSPRDGRRTCIG
jgi:acyl-CoA thioesterase II